MNVHRMHLIHFSFSHVSLSLSCVHSRTYVRVVRAEKTSEYFDGHNQIINSAHVHRHMNPRENLLQQRQLLNLHTHTHTHTQFSTTFPPMCQSMRHSVHICTQQLAFNHFFGLCLPGQAAFVASPVRLGGWPQSRDICFVLPLIGILDPFPFQSVTIQITEGFITYVARIHALT